MKLLSKRRIALDTETTGLFPFLGDRPYFVSTCDNEGKLWGIRGQVDPMTRNVSWTRSQLQQIADLTEDERLPKTYFHAKFDVRHLEKIGIKTLGRIDEVMFMVHVLFSAELIKLKPLAKRWLQISDDDEHVLRAATIKARHEAKKKGWKIAEKDSQGEDPVAADYWLAPPDLLWRYGLRDAERTLLLYYLSLEELEKDPRFLRKYEEEMELWPITYEMEGRGVRCSPQICQFEISRNRIKKNFHYKRVVEAVGRPINLRSPKQLCEYIYGKLAMPVKSYTENGSPATDADSLRKLDHPIVSEIVACKAADVAIGNFFQTYARHIRLEEGLPILHPDFQQLGARTTRFSCRRPNLHAAANAFNTRSFEPIQARTPFGPRPGYLWVHSDWSQIEMWIFAAESQDEDLLADLATGNIHTATANRVFGHGRDIVAEEMKEGRSNARGRAKMLNFGVVFGMGVPAVMDFLKCSRKEAQEVLDLYYRGYPRIKPFMQELSDRAAREGFIWNRFNRRLQVPRGSAYVSVNYLIQSSAAEYMKSKMRWIAPYLRARRALDAYLVLTIHDELVIEVPAPLRPEMLLALKEIKAELENIHGLWWPELKNLPVEFKITRERWDKNEKLEV